MSPVHDGTADDCSWMQPSLAQRFVEWSGARIPFWGTLAAVLFLAMAL